MQHESIVPDVSLLFQRREIDMGNQYTLGMVTYEDRLQRMKECLRKHYPELEYVSGFTDCDGKVIVRMKCGHEREISLISVRHDHIDVNHCKECARIEREKEQEKERLKKHKLIEYERSMKPAKYKQIGFSECPVCGAFYFASKNRYCSKECSKTINNQRQNRRKDFRKRISKTDESKDITLLSVYKKDNGICWICGKPCDYTLDGNDNYYPSIDHVIPIAKGGKDCWDNVRLAHRGCNIVKSDHLFTSPRSV